MTNTFEFDFFPDFLQKILIQIDRILVASEKLSAISFEEIDLIFIQNEDISFIFQYLVSFDLHVLDVKLQPRTTKKTTKNKKINTKKKGADFSDYTFRSLDLSSSIEQAFLCLKVSKQDLRWASMFLSLSVVVNCFDSRVVWRPSARSEMGCQKNEKSCGVAKWACEPSVSASHENIYIKWRSFH